MIIIFHTILYFLTVFSFFVSFIILIYQHSKRIFPLKSFQYIHIHLVIFLICMSFHY